MAKNLLCRKSHSSDSVSFLSWNAKIDGQTSYNSMIHSKKGTARNTRIPSSTILVYGKKFLLLFKCVISAKKFSLTQIAWVCRKRSGPYNFFQYYFHVSNLGSVSLYETHIIIWPRRKVCCVRKVSLCDLSELKCKTGGFCWSKLNEKT